MIFSMHSIKIAIHFEISTTGTDLPVCATEDAQCCSVEYLEAVQKRIRTRFERFLGEEFEGTIEDYQDVVTDLLECKSLLVVQCQ